VPDVGWAPVVGLDDAALVGAAAEEEGEVEEGEAVEGDAVADVRADPDGDAGLGDADGVATARTLNDSLPDTGWPSAETTRHTTS